MAAGEMSGAEFTAFVGQAMSQLTAWSLPGSVHFVCIDWRHVFELIAAGRMHYDELINLCIWAKTNGGMGSLYRSAHELVTVWRNGPGPHRNNVELGRFGRARTNVWNYSGFSGLSRAEDAALTARRPRAGRSCGRAGRRPGVGLDAAGCRACRARVPRPGA